MNHQSFGRTQRVHIDMRKHCCSCGTCAGGGDVSRTIDKEKEQ